MRISAAQVYSFVLFGEQHLLAMFIIVALAAVVPWIVKIIDARRVTQTAAIGLGVALLLCKAGEPISCVVYGEA